MGKLEEKMMRKYGTAGRAMATRHAKQIKGAKSNVEGHTHSKPRRGNFKTIGATAGGQYYKRGKPKRMKPVWHIDVKNLKLKPIKIDRARWIKEDK